MASGLRESVRWFLFTCALFLPVVVLLLVKPGELNPDVGFGLCIAIAAGGTVFLPTED